VEIISNTSSVFRNTELVATVGFFDGVHTGHRYLIEELIKTAKTENRLSAVVTFRAHPRKVLNNEFQPLLLTTFDEKTEQLATTGIDYCIVLDFDLEMAKLGAFDFLNSVLYKQFNVRSLLVGHDHRFGRNRSEGFSEYHSYGVQIGINVLQAKRFVLPDHSHISSSDIRNALKNGEVARANKLLGYPYQLKGVVSDGFKIGRKIGFPTANIQPTDFEKLIPSTGVYAVKVMVDNKMYGGMLNIGVRPTLENGTDRSIEVNIFDFENDIYNREICVVFVAKIRDEVKFDSLEKLMLQLEFDKTTSQNILQNHI